MSDLIDRQAVIDLLKQMRKDGNMVPWEGKDVFARIRKLPTIQPEKAQLSSEDATSDTISRQAALDIFDDYNISVENGELEAYSRDRKRLCELPTIQSVATETNDGDAISRQTAIDAINSWRGRFSEEYNEAIDDCENSIKELPTIQPECKKGEWIEISSINHTYKCSECGRLLVNITDGRNNVSKHYPYCHCGADMRGEPNE